MNNTNQNVTYGHSVINYSSLNFITKINCTFRTYLLIFNKMLAQNLKIFKINIM